MKCYTYMGSYLQGYDLPLNHKGKHVGMQALPPPPPGETSVYRGYNPAEQIHTPGHKSVE